MGDVIEIVYGKASVKAEIANLREMLASLSHRELTLINAKGVDVTQYEVAKLGVTLDLLEAAVSSLPGMRRKL